MPKIDVFECDVHGEFEFVNDEYVRTNPPCPECGKPMRYVTSYTEPED